MRSPANFGVRVKMAIRHRRNSLACKTLPGSPVGDLFLRLIHTCQINRVNPFAYLVTWQKHSQAVAKNPTRWLPWHHPEALAPVDTS